MSSTPRREPPERGHHPLGASLSGRYTGEVAERLNAPVSKTGMGGSVHRGFESLPLRWTPSVLSLATQHERRVALGARRLEGLVVGVRDEAHPHLVELAEPSKHALGEAHLD